MNLRAPFWLLFGSGRLLPPRGLRIAQALRRHITRLYHRHPEGGERAGFNCLNNKSQSQAASCRSHLAARPSPPSPGSGIPRPRIYNQSHPTAIPYRIPPTLRGPGLFFSSQLDLSRVPHCPRTCRPSRSLCSHLSLFLTHSSSDQPPNSVFPLVVGGVLALPPPHNLLPPWNPPAHAAVCIQTLHPPGSFPWTPIVSLSHTLLSSLRVVCSSRCLFF